MRLRDDELVTQTDLRRRLRILGQRLKDGDLDKVVVTNHGRMELVIVSVERYKGLVNEPG